MIAINEDLAEALGAWVAQKIADAVNPLLARLAEVEKRTKAFRHIGIWRDGMQCEAGNFITHDGSVWHCNFDTASRPGKDVGAWTLVCKRGQDGKDALSIRQATTYRSNGAQIERRPTT
jgi:hypothetical protein